ncbi:helix-turn-helix domain-containing protein [Aliikangiella maris]|uniref:Helix-turn-helix domain-containing protein n=3 Tax=Aliikangiella maris TaxID=3162458 RepID=A0ABV2BRE1_9GAMM
MDMHEALEKAVQHWNLVSPVIDTPKNQEDYETLLVNLRDAMTLVENRPNSPLSGLIKAMARAAKEYEGTSLLENQGGALLALRYLIKLHGIKQSELKEVGSQGVVSEILSGKRTLTLRHVKELAKKFNVSPNVFIDA